MDENLTNQNQINIPQLTPEAVNHLVKSAKWAKFLAILGFIITGLLVIGGIAAGAIIGNFSNEFSNMNMPFRPIFLSVICIALAAIYIVPIIYLNNYSNQTIKAANQGDTELMTSAFNNLRKHFTFIGISTIVIMALYVFILIGAGVFTAMSF